MKFFKNIIWVEIFLSLVCFGQGENPLEYYPHNVGDVWQYQRVPEGTITTIQITRVDTCEDGNEHHIFYGNSDISYVRVTIDSARVYYSGNPNPWYKLDVPVGSIWTREEGVEWVKYYEDDIESKWGIELQTRTYYQYFWNPPDSSSGYSGSAEILARGIGIQRYEWEGGRDELIGCIINGVKYGTIVSVEDEKSLPLKFSLFQNYPNPFNPVTIIKFNIASGAKQSVTTLKVFDILGREIKTLLNKPMQPGNYEVKFDGSDLTSGVYFYVLQSGGKRLGKKMLLLK